jgi:hypothetical protein
VILILPITRKTLISTVARLLNDLFSLKTDVYVQYIQKELSKKNYIKKCSWHLEAADEKRRIRIQIVIQFTDPRIQIRLKMSRTGLLVRRKKVIGTIDAPGEAAEESLECVVVKEADWPLLTLLLPSLPTIPVVGGLFRTQSVKPIKI